MNRILAIANAKGGVGKTTTTINLAAALAERKRRVLAVDLDPQASLTLSLGLPSDDGMRSIYQALTTTGMPVAAMLQTTQEGFDLVPANHELNQAVDVLEEDKRRLSAVRAVLEPIRDRYDYILLDCPANAGILTGCALAAADEVVTPLAVDYLAFKSLGWFLTVVKEVKEIVNPNLRFTGIFFTMFDPHTRHARKIMESAREAYASEIPFFATAVRYSASFRDASIAGKSMLRYDSRSAASEAYRCLALEIEEGLGVTLQNAIYFALAGAEDAVAHGDREAAYVQYCRATNLDPQSPRAWIGRAESAVEWEEKVRCYCRALPLTPETGEGRAGLAKCLGDGQMLSVGIHPLITTAHRLEALGEKGWAEKVYARVLELDPKHEEAWLGRARATSDVRMALGYISRCLEVNPGNDLAQSALQSAQERAAAESIQLVESGIAQARLGKRQDASILFQQACDVDPSNDRAWLERARVADDFNIASSHAKRALEINPQNQEARELCNLLYSPAETTAPQAFGSLGLALPLVVIVLLALVILAAMWHLIF